MTVVYTYGGPLKRDIIQRAYGYCGQSYTEFELTPEEYNVGLRAMNDQMAMLGPFTGYNAPDYGDGNAEDESGLRLEDVLGASYYVAKLLAPQIGKQLATSAEAERACTMFLGRCSPIPDMHMRSTTPRGSGNRWSWGFGAYFPPRGGRWLRYR